MVQPPTGWFQGLCPWRVQGRALALLPSPRGTPGAGNGHEVFAALDLEAATVAPELAYVTARYAALAPFGKTADLLSELLPISSRQRSSFCARWQLPRKP